MATWTKYREVSEEAPRGELLLQDQALPAHRHRRGQIASSYATLIFVAVTMLALE